MGAETSKPVGQANIGDTLVRSSYGGFLQEELRVVDVDADRRYIMACDNMDVLYIVNMKRNGSAREGHAIHAACSCSLYEKAETPAEKHKLAWGE